MDSAYRRWRPRRRRKEARPSFRTSWRMWVEDARWSRGSTKSRASAGTFLFEDDLVIEEKEVNRMASGKEASRQGQGGPFRSAAAEVGNGESYVKRFRWDSHFPFRLVNAALNPRCRRLLATIAGIGNGTSSARVGTLSKSTVFGWATGWRMATMLVTPCAGPYPLLPVPCQERQPPTFSYDAVVAKAHPIIGIQ